MKSSVKKSLHPNKRLFIFPTQSFEKPQKRQKYYFDAFEG